MCRERRGAGYIKIEERAMEAVWCGWVKGVGVARAKLRAGTI